MNKFLLINKEINQSSFDVIRILKKEFNHSYFGHSGTLDPLATGLLVIASGKEALKAMRFINSEDKEYIAVLKLGIATDSQDITGKIIDQKEIKYVKDWNSILNSFMGIHFQKPPKFSAKKIKGKKAYNLARKGKEVELKPVKIEVKAIKLLKFSDKEVKFKILVSKGTYIRTLCQDIAIKSGNLGTMSSLQRISVGKFKLQNASNPKDIKQHSIINILEALDLEQYSISYEEFNKIKQGQTFNIKQEGIVVLVYKNKLISVVKIKEGVMSIIRNFNL